MPEATGPVSLPQRLLKNLIANCPTFRAMAGAADALAAQDSIHIGEIRDQPRPRAFIGHGGIGATSKRSGNHFVRQGGLWLAIEESVDADTYEADPEAAWVTFENKVGAILTEAATELANRESALYFEVTQINGPEVSYPEPDQNEGEHFFVAVLEFMELGRLP